MNKRFEFDKENQKNYDFLIGTDWLPNSDKFGVSSMIIASILATLGSLIIGVPIGILTAIFLAEIAPKPVQKLILPAVELLAGIPSVLYGVFGLAIIVPWIQNTFNQPKGQSLLAVMIVLAIMMLPTIVTVSETSIRAVPKSYKEGSLALGASKIETILAELGYIRPISKPDWDNLGKTYSDMLTDVLILDDAHVVDGRCSKYYSLHPRIEMDIKYQLKPDSKYNERKINNIKKERK